MKSKKTKPEAAAPSPKGKVKIKNLKLHKETIKDLSNEEAGGIMGGTYKCENTTGCVFTKNHNEAFVCDALRGPKTNHEKQEIHQKPPHPRRKAR